MLIIGLVVVTIGYESAVEYLEESIFTEGVSRLLMQKMIRELAVLGFVSFTATVILQFVVMIEETKLTFEYSHVLMFITAVFFAIEIAVISNNLPTILEDLERKDEVESEHVLIHETSHWFDPRYNKGDGPMTCAVKRWWSGSFLNRQMHHVVDLSRLKVLRFHFMARHELLAQRKFQWSRYLSRSMEIEIENLIEINWRTWIVLILVLATTLPIHLNSRFSLCAFVVGGWVLLLVEVAVLVVANDAIDHLNMNGHLQRRSAEYHYRVSSGPQQKKIRSVFEVVQMISDTGAADDEDDEHLPQLARVRKEELQIAIRATKTPTLVAQIHEVHQKLFEACPDHGEHFKPKVSLRLLPYCIQSVLLVQCMYQALILTMLGRNVFIAFGHTNILQAISVLVLMWLPTSIMSFLITPRVLRSYSIAASAVQVRREILNHMSDAHTEEGDYSAATQALEMLSHAKLSQAELHDEELVRARVKDLTRLGEMKWRYRVVEEGQSPRDDAINVLTEAKELMESHVKLNERASNATLSSEWGAEMAEVCQGLALARLIFNTHRGEDSEIESLLKQAQGLREAAGLRAEMAETLNGLGSLKEKQRAFSDAEQYYTKSLEIRRLLPEGDDRGKSREQSIAQSLTSIGKLFLAMSDEEKVDSDAGRKSRQNFLAKALESLKAAKDAYTKGFHDGHPKVAWALEGLANVLEKSGDLRGAQGAWSEAIAIRRNLQLKDNKKEMFTKEMKEDEEKMKAIEKKRSAIKGKLRLITARSRDTPSPAPAEHADQVPDLPSPPPVGRYGQRSLEDLKSRASVSARNLYQDARRRSVVAEGMAVGTVEL